MGCNGEQHAGAAATRGRRHLEEVDGGGLDREVELVAQFPACGLAQLGGRNVRRFDLHDLVVARADHGAHGRAPELEIL